MRSDSAAGAVREVGATPVHGDLLDEAGVARAMDGCDVGFHGRRQHPLPIRPVRARARQRRGRGRGRARRGPDAGLPRLVHASSSAIGEPGARSVARTRRIAAGTCRTTTGRSTRVSGRSRIGAGRGLDVVCVDLRPCGTRPRHGHARCSRAARRAGSRSSSTRASASSHGDCTRGHLLAAERADRAEALPPVRRDADLQGGARAAPRLSSRDERPRVHPRCDRAAARGAVELASARSIATRRTCRAMARTLLQATPTTGRARPGELGLQYTPVEDALRAPPRGRGGGLRAPLRGSPSTWNAIRTTAPARAGPREELCRGAGVGSDDDETVRGFLEAGAQAPRPRRLRRGGEHHDHAEEDPEGDLPESEGGKA